MQKIMTLSTKAMTKVVKFKIRKYNTEKFDIICFSSNIIARTFITIIMFNIITITCYHDIYLINYYTKNLIVITLILFYDLT